GTGIGCRWCVEQMLHCRAPFTSVSRPRPIALRHFSGFLSAQETRPHLSSAAQLPLQNMSQTAPWLQPGDEGPSRLALSGVLWWSVPLSRDDSHPPHRVLLVVPHGLWCPKRRQQVLVRAAPARLRQRSPPVADEDEHHWEVSRLALQPAHVHRFLRAPPPWCH